VYPVAWLLKQIRRFGVQRLPFCKKALNNVGVFPIMNHYYEPQFDMRNIKRSFSEERNLPGINWNMRWQLEVLRNFTFADEIQDLPTEKANANELQFYLNNGFFESGDAEYWYQLIRSKKPKRIFEVGCGYSTLMAINAIRKNQEENPDLRCKHVCIEPYERPWLEKTGVSVLRRKVEDVEV
jgi:hypothetical protein